MELGNKIKKFRESIGLSQEELSLRIFVSRQTISNWETNKSYPDIKSLLLLCKLFDVTLDDFIKEDVKEMKEKINEGSLKEFNMLAKIYAVEFIVMIGSAYPLFRFGKGIGIVVWILFFLITLKTAFSLEKIKKRNNIQTYKEIVAFTEGKILTHDEQQQEYGKRKYQMLLLAIGSGIITLGLFIVLELIFG